MLALAFTPWRNAIDLDSPTLGPLLLIGALIGGAVSWFAARPELEPITGQRDTYVNQHSVARRSSGYRSAMTKSA